MRENNKGERGGERGRKIRLTRLRVSDGGREVRTERSWEYSVGNGGTGVRGGKEGIVSRSLRACVALSRGCMQGGDNKITDSQVSPH